MIPCKLCTRSQTSRGLKQVGKTRTVGTHFTRRYRCQDCDAAMVLSGDLRSIDSMSKRWFVPGAFWFSTRGRGRVEPVPPPAGRIVSALRSSAPVYPRAAREAKANACRGSYTTTASTPGGYSRT
jgi:hypothetical protein